MTNKQTQNFSGNNSSRSNNSDITGKQTHRALLYIQQRILCD